jgi:hypothetical protein
MDRFRNIQKHQNKTQGNEKMKRRDFGLLASTSLAAAVTLRPAHAQSAAADASQLQTTLTPMGAERAGNADGSIPAWTGGMVSAPLASDQPVGVRLFEDEQPLYEVNAGNMTQYASILSEGTKAQIQNYGLTMKVYKTHRTAACPQYVYDNAAKNVSRARFDPRGGRFGFTGAVGGPPFPIINTAEPAVGGVQLIWNHLTAWTGYNDVTLFTPGMVVIQGKPVLADGSMARTIYPYYAPDVTPENYNGYLSKGHYYNKAPSSVVGQETLTWHSTNVSIHPDITWTLLNGQGRVRKAPNEQYDTPNPYGNGIGEIDEAETFYGNPSQYNWTFISKKELLVPYNCNGLLGKDVRDLLGANFLKPEHVRWEKHRVWIIEATLAPGQRNVNAKRRLYLDEDTWSALLGEGYDGDGQLWKAYTIYNQCVPSLPGTITMGTATYALLTGDYTFDGNADYGQFKGTQFFTPLPDADFEPQEMAANAAF